jgi:GxxExxY protein
MEKRDPRTYAMIGAAMEVHSQLGCGFLEAVYQEALELEFTARAIAFKLKVETPVFYKQQRLATYYRPDFISFEDVIVEIKAIQQITEIETAQILNYLKATGFSTGLLLNFGAPSLEYKRFIWKEP